LTKTFAFGDFRNKFREFKISCGRPKSKKKFEFSLHPLFRKIFVAPKKKKENTMLIVANDD